MWYFFGDSLSKGKKNDHLFQYACLDSILVRHYKQVHIMNKAITPGLTIVGDNCKHIPQIPNGASERQLQHMLLPLTKERRGGTAPPMKSEESTSFQSSHAPV
jgi:hypothetical protein